MEKKTVIDQIEITRSGMIQIRMRKLIVDDNGTEHDLGYHRTAIEPGSDPNLQMAAVNEHLLEMQMGAVPAEEMVTLNAIVPVVHTPERKEQWRTAREAAAQVREA